VLLLLNFRSEVVYGLGAIESIRKLFWEKWHV